MAEKRKKVETYYSQLPPPTSMSNCVFVPHDIPPRPLPKKSIDKFLNYPNEARINKIEGRVIIRFYVDKEGKVDTKTFEIISGHPQLNQSAIDALLKTEWQPATSAGIKVGVCLTIPVNYSLSSKIK